MSKKSGKTKKIPSNKPVARKILLFAALLLFSFFSIDNTFAEGPETVTNPDGSWTTTYPGGTTATTTPLPGGGTTTAVTNSDGSWTTITTNPDGSVERQNSDGTGSVRKLDGTQTYTLPRDQGTITKRPNANGSETITLPDGSAQTINPDGSTVTTYPDGRTVTRNADGSMETVTETMITLPDGSTQIVKVTTKSDGSTETATMNPDGSWTYQDGRIVNENLDGMTTTIYPDGRRVTTFLNGNTYTHNPDGSGVWTYPDGRTTTIKPYREVGTSGTTKPDSRDLQPQEEKQRPDDDGGRTQIDEPKVGAATIEKSEDQFMEVRIPNIIGGTTPTDISETSRLGGIPGSVGAMAVAASVECEEKK